MGDPFQPGGLRLSDGSRIGGWSMDVIDGKRDESLAPDAGPQEALTADADSFAQRMAENLYYRKLKAQQRAEAEEKKFAKPPAAPTPAPAPAQATAAEDSAAGGQGKREGSRSRGRSRSRSRSRDDRDRDRDDRDRDRRGRHRHGHRDRDRRRDRDRHRRRRRSRSRSRSRSRRRRSRSRSRSKEPVDKREGGRDRAAERRAPAEAAAGSSGGVAAGGAAAGGAEADPAAVEMVVKEKGGEVSASVAETNRIRALLGLKPLAGTEAAAQPADARPAGWSVSRLSSRGEFR